jgi:CRP-like cAMP-binding protein
MLLTLEKVLILKSVSIFRNIPEETLAEVALTLKYVKAPAGRRIVTKGELGRSMYVIISGRVRVHDGDKEIAQLGPREIFGELAALNPEPRSSSVSAIEDTHLFRLDYETLHELIAEHVDLATGIIQVLCQRLQSMH